MCGVLWRKQAYAKNEAIRLQGTDTVEEKVACARADAYLDAILTIEELFPEEIIAMRGDFYA